MGSFLFRTLHKDANPSDFLVYDIKNCLGIYKNISKGIVIWKMKKNNQYLL